ncbi:MAG: leucine-rich repeat protein, partial [Bacteroidales bacterium]|nr:leucine-rich repeat protein [Bacteroidales bacterium]
FFLSTLFVANGLMAQNGVLIDGIRYNLDSNALTASVVEYWDSGNIYQDSCIIIPENVVYETIKYTVTLIDDGAFSGCYNLTSITIPESVTTIYLAFDYCTNLKFYTGPACFFDRDYRRVNNFESITITEGELSRKGTDFINLSYRTLREIDLSGIENIEIPDMAFNNCYKLEKVTFPSQLESIGYKSFAGCTALEGISIPASVTKIDNSAFEDCRSMSKIVFDGSELKASTSNLETIGKWAFYNCHNLQNIEIPEGVTSIGDAAFYGCTYLQDLQLPSTLKSLGDNTFALCENLKSMTILAENPPLLYEKSFYNVDHTIPVSVPESSLKSYEETPYWSEFIHYKSADATAINGISNATSVVIANNQILVNGEAPAFVVTISGRKIANQNLNSGVYFVNVEGETVKVSVQ